MPAMRRLTDWLRRRPSRVLRLPDRGSAIVVSDLHGGWPDWEAFLTRSQALERIADGEDLWLVLTGDVPDVTRHTTVDPRIPGDGDVRILDELLAFRAGVGPERGRRVVYVEGNHDFHVARVAVEARRYAAQQEGRPLPALGSCVAASPAVYERFCAFYRQSYGEAVFQNNVAPYDMVPRASEEHLRFVTSGPVLVVLGGSRVAVTHAGPTRCSPGQEGALRREIERADPVDLAGASAEVYFASAYHQLLNNRYRHGDYTLDDLEAFLALWGCGALVTGHTPHPYLFDLERGEPLPDCDYLEGVGLIGGRQLVLCSSFGAFLPATKRYLELPLDRPFEDARALAQTPGVARALYSEAEAAGLAEVCRPLPGAELL